MRARTKNEIFTPVWMVNQMLNQPHMSDLNHLLLEPSFGKGVFLIQALKQRFNKLSKKGVHQNLTHQLLIQLSLLYGIELFPDNVKIARHDLYKTFLSLTPKVSQPQKKLAKRIINANLICGNTLTGQNVKVTQWSHHFIPQTEDWKFFKRYNQNLDIIGNPPYNTTAKHRQHTTNSYTQLYNKFVMWCLKLNPKEFSMIIPNRGFSGGRNLSQYRKQMLNDSHIQSLNIWNNSHDVFTGTTTILGGVHYFLWNRNYNNRTKGIKVSLYHDRKRLITQRRPLKIYNLPLFISNPFGINILSRLKKYLKHDNLSQHISSRVPFGMQSAYYKTSHFKEHPIKNSYQCLASRKTLGYITKPTLKKMILPSHQKYLQCINYHKVLLARANGLGISSNTKINPIIIGSNSVCTDTYLIIGYDFHQSLTTAQHLAKYLITPTIRFLISLRKNSLNAPKKVYELIPVIDFTDDSQINWNQSMTKLNNQLQALWQFSDAEKHYINVHFPLLDSKNITIIS